MGSHLRSWCEIPYLLLALSLLWGVYHVHIPAKLLSINAPRVLCASTKHPVSDKSLVFQGPSKSVARILKNVIYWAGWEVRVIVLNALADKAASHFIFSASWFHSELLKGSAIFINVTAPRKGSHQCGSCFNQGQRVLNTSCPWDLPCVAASDISAPSIWGCPGWGRARPVTPCIAALSSCRIPQLPRGSSPWRWV